jgi:hypothetical protein
MDVVNVLGEFRPSDKIQSFAQSGKLKVITPELTTFRPRHGCFGEMESKKPISAIYFDGEKSAITSNAFGRNRNKEEAFISC